MCQVEKNIKDLCKHTLSMPDSQKGGDLSIKIKKREEKWAKLISNRFEIINFHALLASL